MEYVPDHPDPEGLECVNCPEGTYEEGETTETLERGNTVVVVREVPAYVCNVCGDSLLSQTVTKRLHSILDRAEELKVESLVCQYGEDDKIPAAEE